MDDRIETKTKNQDPGSETTAFVLDHSPIVCRDWNKPITFEVPITNAFSEVIRFKNFACDCGCTSAQCDRDELQPGESSIARMTVNLAGREGPQRFVCRWNDQSDRRWSSETRVIVYRPAEFEAKNIQLGQVSPGDTIKKQIHYDEYSTSASELPGSPSFSTSGTQVGSLKIDVYQSTIESVAPGLLRRRTPIDISFSIPNAGGSGDLLLTPKTTQQLSELRPTLHLDWKVQESVELTPARLALTLQSDTNIQQTRLVRIRSLVSDVIAIERITSTDSNISARIVSAAKNATDYSEIEISVTIPQGKRLLTGDVVLHLTPPAAHEVRIPITAVRVGSSNGEKRP